MLEATNAPEGLHDACRAAAIGGEVTVVGIPDGNEYHDGAGEGRFRADELRRKGLTLRWARRMDGDRAYPAAIDLVARGAVDVDALVSHRFDGVGAAPAAFALMEGYEDGVLKPVIDVRTHARK